jgi:hypothetical protein
MFPNQKKKKIPSIQLTIPESSIQKAEIQSLGNVPIEKKKKRKKKEMLVMFPNQKKIPLLPFNLLKFKVQVQEMFLKKKKRKC